MSQPLPLAACRSFRLLLLDDGLRTLIAKAFYWPMGRCSQDTHRCLQGHSTAAVPQALHWVCTQMTLAGEPSVKGH